MVRSFHENIQSNVQFDGSISEQNISNYQFENLHKLCDQFNTFNGNIKVLYKAQKKWPVLNNVSKTPDPYSCLEKNDPSRYLTRKQILDWSNDMSEINLSPQEKESCMKTNFKYQKAFGIHDLIRGFPNITIDIEVIDKLPFIICPFPVSEEDKPIKD